MSMNYYMCIWMTVLAVIAFLFMYMCVKFTYTNTNAYNHYKIYEYIDDLRNCKMYYAMVKCTILGIPVWRRFMSHQKYAFETVDELERILQENNRMYKTKAASPKIVKTYNENYEEPLYL